MRFIKIDGEPHPVYKEENIPKVLRETETSILWYFQTVLFLDIGKLWLSWPFYKQPGVIEEIDDGRVIDNQGLKCRPRCYNIEEFNAEERRFVQEQAQSSPPVGKVEPCSVCGCAHNPRDPEFKSIEKNGKLYRLNGPAARLFKALHEWTKPDRKLMPVKDLADIYDSTVHLDKRRMPVKIFQNSQVPKEAYHAIFVTGDHGCEKGFIGFR